MAESPRERTARLLAEGLELFGRDRVEQAIARWREVLALDPGHREARDYLESAGVTAPGAEERAAASRGLALAEQGKSDQALALLAGETQRAPRDLDVQAALDLVRAHLYAKHRARLGAGKGKPRLKVSPAELKRFDLPPQAGFLISILDGKTPVDELLAVSGMDAFEAVRLLARLEAAGIVELAR
jgi:tetratricopeptide (TPR) repeat protein